MKTVLRSLASLRVTMAGLAVLIVNCVAVSQWPDASIPWLVAPLSLLVVNLLAALLVRQAFRRQGALLLFHVGLLGVLLLVTAGILLRFDGSVEVVEGTAFDAAAVTVRDRGWLHPERLGHVRFTQGPLEVNYLSGLRRDTTHSRVALSRADGREVRRDIGDRQGFTSRGYRFMTTFNKGYALLVLWRDAAGRERLGTVNFPSFPEFEWKQINEWVTPAGDSLTFELRPAQRVATESAWSLRSRGVDYAVGIRDEAQRTATIRPGQSLAVPGGEITIVDLRLWMGYRIDYNPLLPWLLAAAFLSLAALAVHTVQKFRPATATPGVAVPTGQQAA
jgi:cytochrome c biogenesis protein